MVGEVLLIDFRVVHVGGAPGEITSVSQVQSISKLVVQVDGDIAPDPCGNGAVAATQLKVRRGTGFNRHGNINKFTRGDIVRDTDNVRTNGVRLEDVWHNSTHAAVGWRVGDGFARHHVAMLVDHVGRDGQGLIR